MGTDSRIISLLPEAEGAFGREFCPVALQSSREDFLVWYVALGTWYESLSFPAFELAAVDHDGVQYKPVEAHFQGHTPGIVSGAHSGDCFGIHTVRSFPDAGG